LFPGKRYEDRALEGPAGEGVESLRLIRDDIKARVLARLAELGVAPVRVCVDGCLVRLSRPHRAISILTVVDIGGRLEQRLGARRAERFGPIEEPGNA
jgi:hypothetical protein